jgi:hypothetical protein
MIEIWTPVGKAGTSPAASADAHSAGDPVGTTRVRRTSMLGPRPSSASPSGRALTIRRNS